MLLQRQDWMNNEVYEWYLQEEKARLNSLKRWQSGGKRALVLIKAQHPLTSDGKPNKEYTMRLNEALKIKSGLENEGIAVTFMTVGGIHAGNENFTLAEAGANYLASHGVDKNAILQRRSVYSGNDEDRLAAEEFERGNYARLYVCLSAGQWERARLYFMFMGWQPELRPVTMLEERPNHSMVCELWGAWGVPAFAKGTEAIRQATEQIVRKHLDEANQ